MKKKIILGLAFSAFAFPAMATDLYMPPAPAYRAPIPFVPVFSWNGCYLGADIGGAMSRQDVTNTAPNQAGVSGTINANSVMGGGYVGCNYQWSPAWVIGIEGDFTALNLVGTTFETARNLDGTPAPVTWSSNVNALATVRARVGYAWSPNLLFFATGGGAWGRTGYTSSDLFPGGCPASITSFGNTGSGYVVGAGMDWAPWRNNWIIRAEYLYYNLSGATSNIVQANPVWNNISINTARVGVAYKF